METEKTGSIPDKELGEIRDMYEDRSLAISENKSEVNENWTDWRKEALRMATNIFPWLDQADNAGFDQTGKLTIVDAEELTVADLKYYLRKEII